MVITGSILPYVVGGLGFFVIVLLVALSALLVWLIRREEPQWVDSDVVAAREAPVLKSMPNSRAHWRVAPAPEWTSTAAAEVLSERLRTMTFQRSGAFTHNGKGTVIDLWALPAHHAAGWIERNAEDEIDLTVCSWDEDGVPIRVSTVKNESSFVLIHGELRQISGSRSPEDLCRQLVELRTGRVLHPFAVETVVELLNREERMRARRLTQDPETADIWGRNLLKTHVMDKATGDKISGRTLRSVFLSQLGDTITDCCLETFAEESRISAAEWARLHERFLVVHDRLSAEELGHLDVCESLSDAERRKIRPFLKKKVPARAAFEAMNAELPFHLRYTEVGRVSDPIEATVYLAS